MHPELTAAEAFFGSRYMFAIIGLGVLWWGVIGAGVPWAYRAARRRWARHRNSSHDPAGL